MEKTGAVALPALDYEVPVWGCCPEGTYTLETVKNGVVIEEIKLHGKDHWVFGRLPVCDVNMEHASISRFHAVLQFGPAGKVCMYDLGSAHGTYVNKERLLPRIFVEICGKERQPPAEVAVLRFGESSRLYVLSGGLPEEQKRVWETSPLQYLRSWATKLGEELEISVAPIEGEVSGGFEAEIALQSSGLDEATGRLLVGRAQGSSKRAAVEAAALALCQELEDLGQLTAASSGKRSRRIGETEEIVGADAFFDRTAPKKRPPAARRIETVAGLYEQEAELRAALATLQSSITEAEAALAGGVAPGDEDEVDAAFRAINVGGARADLARLSSALMETEADLARVLRLLAIADPKAEHRPSFAPPRLLKPTKPMLQTAEPELTGIESGTGEDATDWLPPDQAESDRARQLKDRYGY